MTHQRRSRRTNRRRFQFTLRTLLIVVLIIACLLSWLGAKLRRAAEQWTIAAELRRAGFQITYVSEFPEVDSLEDFDKLLNPPGPSWLRQKLGFEPFVEIGALFAGSAGSREIDDDTLALLAEVPEVQMIGLRNTQITDRGLIHLRKLRNVSYLGLENTEVTDAGLERLEDMTQIKQLYLSGTKVTDDGLAHLKGMPRLVILEINDTIVTDAGLAHLRDRQELMVIFATNTRITEEGVRELLKTAPRVSVQLGAKRITRDRGQVDD